jgi:hypothetical protein
LGVVYRVHPYKDNFAGSETVIPEGGRVRKDMNPQLDIRCSKHKKL